MPYVGKTGLEQVKLKEGTRSVVAKESSICQGRVFLADDHQEMLQTIALILGDSFQIVGMAEDGQTVLELAPRLFPDVLILDISMPTMNGIEIAERLRTSGCNSKVVFLTVYEDSDFVEAAMSAGPAGYVLKAYLCTDLVPAIRTVLAGTAYVSPFMHLHSGQRFRKV
jgi:DNA-binding NarL/FixJ family response regulator